MLAYCHSFGSTLHQYIWYTVSLINKLYHAVPCGYSFFQQEQRHANSIMDDPGRLFVNTSIERKPTSRLRSQVDYI